MEPGAVWQFSFCSHLFALLSSININTTVTSVSKSTTWVIVPVYYSETAEGKNIGNVLQPFTPLCHRCVWQSPFFLIIAVMSAESFVLPSLMEWCPLAPVSFRNFTIRFMPIPIIDASQALKASPEKTEDALLKVRTHRLLCLFKKYIW